MTDTVEQNHDPRAERLEEIRERVQYMDRCINFSVQNVDAVIDRKWLLVEVDRLRAERDQLLALVSRCTCATTYATYEGPEPDCPVHGAVRALNEAHAELDRLRAERDQAVAAELRRVGEELLELRDSIRQREMAGRHVNPKVDIERYAEQIRRRAAGLAGTSGSQPC